jgi:formylglycine-generating enzyme required for sulfatase activity
MARNPDADSPRRRFAALLDGHLRAGTRPRTAAGEPWTYAEFAGQVESGRDNQYVSERTVSNWCKGTALPGAIEPILRALFGDGVRHAVARAALRSAFIAARDERKTQLDVIVAGRDPAGTTWTAAGDQFAIDRQSAPSDAAAASDPIRQQLLDDIKEIAADLAAASARVENQRTWAKLSATAKALGVLLEGDPAAMPERLGALYAKMLRLGRFLDSDTLLRSDGRAGDEPLDADIHGYLVDLLRLAAPWLRGFPTIAAMDDEAGKMLVWASLFDPAKIAVRKAQDKNAISDEDADEMEILSEASDTEHFLGQKAGARAVGGAQNLILAAAGAVGVFLSGAVASDFATRSLLVQRAGAFLAAAEQEVEKFAVTLPPDLRHALMSVAKDAHLVADERRNDDAAAVPPAAPGVERRFQPLKENETRDGPGLPILVRIPKGTFLMGVPRQENRREKVPKDEAAWSAPQRTIEIAQPFWLGRYPVTRGQFAAFVNATHYETPNEAWTFEPNEKGEWDYEHRKDRSWRNPGFEQTDYDPVVCVNFDDAMAYLEWLKMTTEMAYRLPSEAEWEYAARADTTTARFWGDGRAEATRYAKVADRTLMIRMKRDFDPDLFFDGESPYPFTAPVGSFLPNPFGLHDMLGNVWEWTSDHWVENLKQTPMDGTPNTNGDSSRRVLRGGSWNNNPWIVRAGYRSWAVTGGRSDITGFRVARTSV